MRFVSTSFQYYQVGNISFKDETVVIVIYVLLSGIYKKSLEHLCLNDTQHLIYVNRLMYNKMKEILSLSFK